MLSRIMAVALMGMAVGACAGSGGNPFASAPPPSATLANEPPPNLPTGPMPGETPIERTPAPPSPAVANAAIGGMFGAVGAGLDDDDKQRAYAAQVQALESGGPGAPVGWKNPDSGHYGSIVPGPTFDRGGNKCRQYTHTIYIDGKPSTARGAACRSANGRWIPAG
jgi:surface antigen